MTYRTIRRYAATTTSLLYFYSGLGYDFDTQQLIWRDGHTCPAELMLSKPNTLLLRVR